ncbi:MAG TPA: cob(I)yrinic acid a,c-diamide adenosyltransferase [Tepidisphaeraceae bacterium]|jgi:cob(I)alamin adenosyltransferase
MKIYTKSGDDGTTGLFGGGRISKSSLRIECTGQIDELNACIGLVAAVMAPSEMTQRFEKLAPLREKLPRIQAELFVIGSHLSVPEGKTAGHIPALEEELVTRLEREIDAADADLPPLRNFILPGGSMLAAHLHVARTIARRAERALAALAEHEPLPPLMQRYLNRLSDWLFTMARWCNAAAGVADVEWKP